MSGSGPAYVFLLAELMEQAGLEFTDDVRGELLRVKQDTVYYRRLIRDMAAYFNCEPALEAVKFNRAEQSIAVATMGVTDREEIEKTIKHGIRSDDKDTRAIQMPRFGLDKVLEEAQIVDVAEYVLKISGQNADAAATDRGKKTYDDQCAACHGADHQGTRLSKTPVDISFKLANGTVAQWRAGDVVGCDKCHTVAKSFIGGPRGR